MLCGDGGTDALRGEGGNDDMVYDTTIADTTFGDSGTGDTCDQDTTAAASCEVLTQMSYPCW